MLEPQYEFELDEAFAKIRESLQGEDMEKFRSDFLDSAPEPHHRRHLRQALPLSRRPCHSRNLADR